MAKSTLNEPQGIRAKLVLVLRWGARGVSLLASGFYILLFISSRLNQFANPLTSLDLLIITGLAVCMVGCVAAWRWPRAGGATTLAATGLLLINVITNQTRYWVDVWADVFETIFVLVYLCGPFFLVGLLFMAEGVLKAKESEAAMSTPLAKTDSLTIRQTLQRLALVSIPVLILIGVSSLWVNPNWRPFNQSDLFTHTIYAYRQWQSTGYYLNSGDRVIILASGQWMYSPLVGWHSPEGGEPAPSYYPMPLARGGALIGKIGDDGQPFVVGWSHELMAQEPGLLYLRINDDRLGDNQGALNLNIQIISPTATARP